MKYWHNLSDEDKRKYVDFYKRLHDLFGSKLKEYQDNVSSHIFRLIFDDYSYNKVSYMRGSNMRGSKSIDYRNSDCATITYHIDHLCVSHWYRKYKSPDSEEIVIRENFDILYSDAMMIDKITDVFRKQHGNFNGNKS